MSEILEEDLEKQYQSELRVRDIRKKQNILREERILTI